MASIIEIAGTDAAREACRTEMDEAGLSIAAAARQMGRSSATLSRWLAGTYPGDVASVTARVNRWLRTRREGRALSIDEAGLDRHAETGMADEIETALSYAQETGEIVLVDGPPGRGKTWAARRYCVEHTGAVYIAATRSMTTISGLMSRLCQALALAPARGGSALEAESLVIEHMHRRGGLIVVDEVHYLRDALLDELRCIRDNAGCGLALVGEDRVRMALNRCPQIRARIGMRVDLKAVVRDDVAMIAAGPMGRLPSKAELRILVRVAERSGGYHSLRRVLTEAWKLMRAEDAGGMTVDILDAAERVVADMEKEAAPDAASAPGAPGPAPARAAA